MCCCFKLFYSFKSFCCLKIVLLFCHDVSAIMQLCYCFKSFHFFKLSCLFKSVCCSQAVLLLHHDICVILQNMLLLQAILSSQVSLLLAILQVVSLLQDILSSQLISFFDIRIILQVMLKLCHSVLSNQLIISNQLCQFTCSFQELMLLKFNINLSLI